MTKKLSIQSNNGNGSFRAVGLFAGIGGVELGLERAGWTTEALCEIDEYAQDVLSRRFDIPKKNIIGDIKDMRALPRAELVSAGFPCQDLSQAGKTVGIRGARSGLVGEVFRLLESSRPRWLLLENVPFMLRLNAGRAMNYLIRSLEGMGFSWAYRIVNTRAFGLPHRRKRVLLVASREEDPRGPLFNQDSGPPTKEPAWDTRANGFFWTEGLRGVGWAVDHVPTLKCGSTVGIASPPAIWLTDAVRGDSKFQFITPTIEVAERLQGFRRNWTRPESKGDRLRNKARWRMVGNAVSVPVAEWIGSRLKNPEAYADKRMETEREFTKGKWPDAAWGQKGKGRFSVPVSHWPIRKRRPRLHEFLGNISACPHLSARATAGFLSRFERGTLRANGAREDFIAALRAHIKAVSNL